MLGDCPIHRCSMMHLQQSVFGYHLGEVSRDVLSWTALVSHITIIWVIMKCSLVGCVHGRLGLLWAIFIWFFESCSNRQCFCLCNLLSAVFLRLDVPSMPRLNPENRKAKSQRFKTGAASFKKCHVILSCQFTRSVTQLQKRTVILFEE